MDLAKIVSELKDERDRIDRAIRLLTGADAHSAAAGKRATVRASARAKPRHGGITPAGRKRLSEAMKKRWAEKRKKRVKGVRG